MSKPSRHPLITGAAILTMAGIITRFIGFFYKIFLSHTIGAEGLGIYQLVFPVYSLCFALVVSGIQTGISRCCAAAFAEKNPPKSRAYFLSGLIFSLGLSCITAFLLYQYAGPISTFLLSEKRCEPLLRLISFSIPLGTLHTCISAWYFSRNRTGIPAFSQLLEQLVRVISSYILYLIFLEKGWEPSPILAAAGILAGEMSSALFSAICILFHFQDKEYNNSPQYSLIICGKELVCLSLPLTANRLLLTILQSTESILIPGKLEHSGLTASQSLSIYGILTGMALPFILFPSAITNSVSTVLLPVISGEQALGNDKKIQEATENTIKYCLLLGIFATGIFFFFGKSLGTLVYGNEDAGTFIRTLSFLCPFLYLTGTLSSILNGLGHTGLCFLQNAIGLAIRILFVMICIPRYGITGYLWGILISQLVITTLNLYFIHSKVNFSLDPFSWIIVPAASLIISCAAATALFRILSHLTSIPGLITLLGAMVVCAVVYMGCLVITGLCKFRFIEKL